MDLVDPLIGFGGQPFVPACSAADVAAKEAVASDHIVGVDETAKEGAGGFHVVGGGDEDTLPGVQVVAINFALLFETCEEFLQILKLAASIAIVGKPNVEEIGELGFQITDQRENRKAVENHSQRVSLGDAFFAVEEATGTGGGVHNQEATVAVAVENKMKRDGPKVAHVPDCDHPVDKVEGVDCVSKEEAKVRFLGHLFPELSGGVDATFDARLEANTKLVGATGFGGHRAGEVNHGFGHETAPNLSDANGADAWFFVEGNEAVGHQSSDGGPGANLVGKPLGEAGNGFAETLAVGFVTKEPSFEGGAVGAAKARCAFEALCHIGDGGWGDKKDGADRGSGMGGEVGRRKAGVWFGMFGFEQFKDGEPGCFIKLFGVKNAGGFLPFGKEADSFLCFAFLKKVLEGFQAFLQGGVASLGRELGFHVADCCGDQHVEVPFVPVIESASKEGVDGRAATSVLLLLEDHHDEDKEFFGVVVAIHNAVNESGKGGQESLGQTFGEVVVVGVVGGEVFVAGLPLFVIGDAAIKVVAIILVEVVTTHFC